MCQLFCATRGADFNQSDEDWHHAPDSCTLEVFRVSPKREFSHFYLALFNNFSHFYLALFNNFFFNILKTKSIQVFMNGNNSLSAPSSLQVNDWLWVWSRPSAHGTYSLYAHPKDEAIMVVYPAVKTARRTVIPLIYLGIRWCKQFRLKRKQGTVMLNLQKS